jgi:ElaB/YqjD/DUF883 family membrane-anchored ribosome-binding protein
MDRGRILTRERDHEGRTTMTRHRNGGAPAFHKAARVVSETRDLARVGASRANSFIHARPIFSTVLGVAAGFVLGRLFPRGD